MPPDASASERETVVRLLSQVERRLRLEGVLHAVTVGLAAGTAVSIGAAVASRSSAVVAIALTSAFVAAIAAGWRGRAGWRGTAAAATIERAIPASRNAVFTARELVAAPGQFAPWMEQRVVASAAAIAAQASARAIVPLAPALGGLALALCAVALVAAGVPRRIAGAAVRVVNSAHHTTGRAGPGRLVVRVTITSPAYARQPVRTVVDPVQLEILQGSRLALALSGPGRWGVRFGAQAVASIGGNGETRAELIPPESGYFAIERQGDEGERRLLPVTVIPDRPPVVKLEKPARDLVMPDARATVPVVANAIDDFGLDTLELRYTRVSGTGEQFEFVEGTLPIAVARATSRTWVARGRFDLTALGLVPGDSLVYRAVARDARPGVAGTSVSDTFFIEIAGPGQVALPGFELPPDKERYAYSQQMIVLTLERLRPREASLTAEARGQEVDTIAAEQRAVRANFIFLMGGHVEDEEEEAAQSNEIQEGRLENNARREINTAIGFMSQVEQALAAGQTAAALPPARSAVAALQRAFGRNRYFLRTLAVRSRVDPTRRLTGELESARDWRRLLEPPSIDPKAGQARELLAALLALAPIAASAASSSASAVATLAEDALRVDPADHRWQAISASLVGLHDVLTARQPAVVVQRAFQAALTPLAAMARASAISGGEAEQGSRLRSAWTDEARRR